MVVDIKKNVNSKNAISAVEEALISGVFLFAINLFFYSSGNII